MSDYARREFLAVLGALGVSASRGLRVNAAEPSPARIRPGYAAITWGGKDDQAIDEIAEVGFKAIQLRASAFDAYGPRPAALKELLEKRGLTLAVLSSGNLKYQPADRAAQISLHLSHAAFVRDAGGQFLQVIDEKPKDRPVRSDDYKALADMLNTLGERTKAIGVPLVYHHHMNSTGEAPDAIEAIMKERSASAVGLLFDIAHYQQGGGEPERELQLARRAGGLEDPASQPRRRSARAAADRQAARKSAGGADQQCHLSDRTRPGIDLGRRVRRRACRGRGGRPRDRRTRSTGIPASRAYRSLPRSPTRA